MIASTTVPWFITMHALARMVEMGVERPEVVACLDEPELTRRCFPLPRRIATRGRIAVVFDPDRHTVVTVIWATQEVTDRNG